jgi:hypothetical protein
MSARATALRLVVSAALLLGAAAGAAADEWTVRTGIHLDLWDGAGQSGHQVLAPYALSFDTPSWGASIRGAYGVSDRDPIGGGADSITGFTDTTLSGYYRFVAAETEFRLGLDLDLPTGKSRLSVRQVLSVQDEDLVALERFGEGFDVNPNLRIYRNFGVFGLGLGVGYLITGKYDPTEAPNDDLDPGNELTIALLGDVYATDTIRVIGRASYTYFSADERRGSDVFREGDEIDLLVTAEWRPEPWWVAVTLRDIVRFKAERADAAGRLVTESRNSHGNDIRGGVTVGYIFNDVWTAQGAVDVRHVLANDYPTGDPLRDGGRTKVAVGPTVTFTPHRRFAVEAGFRYFIMDVEASPFFPRSGTINGIHADLRLTYRF